MSNRLGLEIKCEADARLAIMEVCDFLSTAAIDTEGEFTTVAGERFSRPLAANFCHLLLEAAKSNGLGGCPLCRS